MRKTVLLISLSLLLLSSTTASSQSKRSRFDPDGTFWVHGDPPAKFSDFSAINLNAKKLRRLGTAGLQENNGRNYRFKTISVNRDNFTFTTMTVGGVSYSFAGKFLRGGVYERLDLNDETPVLEGTLTKFRGGTKVAEAQLKFVYFGGT